MRLVLTADDTTGALETAAAWADAGWSTVVASHERSIAVDDGAAVDHEVTVIDLRSRHATPEVAAARLAAAGAPVAHKIDSTLRGNWAAEIGALRADGRVVVMVPSYPAAGRVCVGGVVSEHGVPVDRSAHADDPRSPVRSARPATEVPGAVELADAESLAGWLTGAAGGDVAVVDAPDDASLTAAVVAVAAVRAGGRGDVVLVGTAGVLGELARQLAAPLDVVPRVFAADLERPVLVVAGSAHPVARAQAASVRATAMRHVHVLMAPEQRRSDPARVVASLAREARRTVELLGIATVVVLGGDTAEAVIGDSIVRVHGSLGVGVAVGTAAIGGHDVTLVSKPGAFGDAGTVTRLLGTPPDSGTNDGTNGR